MNGHSEITRYNVAERLMDAIGEPMWQLTEVKWEHFPPHFLMRKLDRDVVRSMISEGHTKASIARHFNVHWNTVHRNSNAES